MAGKLQQHIDRLNIPIGVVQHASVLGIFEVLISQGKERSKDAASALQTCVTHSSQGVVAFAVEQLVGAYPTSGLSRSEIIDLLLSSLSSRASVHGTALNNGLVSIFEWDALNGGAVLGWSKSVLSKALLAAPAHATTCLLPPVVRLLTGLSRRSAQKQKALRDHLQPFLSFALLTSGSSAGTTFSSSLHSELVRLSWHQGPTRGFLLDLLCGLAAMHRVADVQREAWVLPAMKDLLESLLSSEDEQMHRRLGKVTAALVVLGGEMQQGGASNAQICSLLLPVAKSHPKVLQPHVFTLAGWLSDQATGDSACLQLIATSLQGDSASSASAQALQGLLIYPLLTTVAMQPWPKKRAWGGHLLSKLESKAHQTTSPAPAPAGATSVGLTPEEAAADMLKQLQGNPEAAIAWLTNLRGALEHRQGVKAPPEGDGGPTSTTEMLSPALCMLLAALTLHEVPRVRRQAVLAVSAVPASFPLMGILFVPLLVYLLQTSTAPGKKASREAAELQSAVLWAIPKMAQHSACIPFCLRILKPQSTEGSPDALKALALRLETQLWLVSRRNFTRLQATLLGYSPPTGNPSPLLRVSRAACIRDVCRHDPHRGTELVTGIQEMLGDRLEGVAGLGMECISLLCAADVLDFYSAWPVVLTHFPDLPRDRPSLAVKWLGLLANGALDARAYPDRSAALIDLLWLASKDPSPQVRGAAYRALASYPLQDLEASDSLRPLQEHAALLLQEVDETARRQCMPLAILALKHEHSIRRRYLAGQGKGGEGEQRKTTAHKEGSVMGRLSRTIPKALLSTSRVSGVDLLLWTPPPAKGVKDKEGRAAAKGAALQYAEKAKLILDAEAGSFQTGHLGHHGLLVHSWRAFLRRWLSAASAGDEAAGSKGASRSIIHTLAVAGESRSGGRVIATATLCGLLGEAANDSAAAALQEQSALIESANVAEAVAAAIGLGLTAPALHPTDLVGRRAAAEKLLGTSVDSERDESVRAACGEGFGMLIGGIAAEISEQEYYDAKSGRVRLVREAVGQLLTVVGACAPRLLQVVEPCTRELRLTTQTLHTAQSMEATEEHLLLSGVFAGLGHAAAAICQLDEEVVPGLIDRLTQSPEGGPAGLLQAACLVLPALLLASSNAEEGLQAEDAAVARTLGFLERIAGMDEQPGTVKGMACAAMGTLLAQIAEAEDVKERWLPILLGPLAAAQKLPGSTALVVGVAAGVSSMLGTPGLLPGSPTPGERLRNSPEAGNAILKALEALTGSSTLVSAKPGTTLLLAAACAAARRGRQAAPKGTSQVGGGDLLQQEGLKGLQADGAMLPLAEYVLKSTQGDVEVLAQDGSLVAVLECLAASPRLPILRWGTLCNTWLAMEAEDVSTAALRLALAHGGQPQTGLSQLLHDLLQPGRLGKLLGSHQALLALHLPALLAALPPQSQSTAVASLAALAQQQGHSLLLPLFQGLRACLASPAPPPAGLHQTLGGLMRLLPPPPKLLFDERLTLASGIAAEQHADGDANDLTTGAPEGEDVAGSVGSKEKRLWTAALACLQHLFADQAAKALSGLAASASLFAEICLLHQRPPELQALERCRNACVDLEADVGDSLFVPLASAAGALRRAEQHQMLAVGFDSIRGCKQQGQALKCMSVLAAACLAADRGGGGHVEAQLSAANAALAMRLLPQTMGVLLRRPGWQQVSPRIVQSLVGLLDTQHQWLAREGLLAVKERLPDEALAMLVQTLS